MKYYITGTRRGLGKYLHDNLETVDSLEECDIFINCKHYEFDQINLLYDACELGKQIINIGSNSSDGIKKKVHKYAVIKAALEKANEQLFYLGNKTTIIKCGYLDTESSSKIKEPKLELSYMLELILWLSIQPHRIKDITVIPNVE